MTPPALVLWDGTCGFCRRAVLLLQRRDRRGAFSAVPYQQAPTPPMTPSLREACAKAVHVVTPDGQVLRAGRAVLYIVGQLGHAALARVLAVPPLVWAVEFAYLVVARNRRLLSRVLFRRA